MRKVIVLAAVSFFFMLTGCCTRPVVTQTLGGDPQPSLTNDMIPKKKQTTLGLYATAKEAYERWKADPDHVKILDCRTPEEYIFVGHAPMAYNIPKKFLEYKWNADKKKPVMKDNPDFVATAQKKFRPTDTIFVHCRSGARSAQSVNMLTEAGFKNVYNIIDGFEGDKIKDPGSYFNGKRMRNGWKNSGAPWTYDLQPDLMYLP